MFFLGTWIYYSHSTSEHDAEMSEVLAHRDNRRLHELLPCLRHHKGSFAKELSIGRSDRRLGRLALATSTFRAAVASASNSFERAQAKTELGITLLKDGQTRSAARALFEASIDDPTFRLASLHLSTCLFRLGRDAQAETVLDIARRLEPADGETKVADDYAEQDQPELAARHRARAERLRGNWVQGERMLKNLMENEPVGGRIFLLEYLMRIDLPHRARIVLAELEDLLNAENVDFIGWSAYVEAAGSPRLEKAKAAIKIVEVLNKHPALLSVWGLRLLQLLEETHADEELIAWADLILQRDPHNVVARTRKARALRQTNKSAAITTLDALNLDSLEARKAQSALVYASLLAASESETIDHPRVQALLDRCSEDAGETREFRRVQARLRGKKLRRIETTAFDKLEEHAESARRAENDVDAILELKEAFTIARELGLQERALRIARQIHFLAPLSADSTELLVEATDSPEHLFEHLSAQDKVARPGAIQAEKQLVDKAFAKLAGEEQ